MGAWSPGRVVLTSLFFPQRRVALLVLELVLALALRVMPLALLVPARLVLAPFVVLLLVVRLVPSTPNRVRFFFVRLPLLLCCPPFLLLIPAPRS